MLSKEPDDTGRMTWRQIAGLGEHGEYHHEIPDEDCLDIARQTIAYESAFIQQEIAFFEYIDEYFANHKTRHVQRTYDTRLREYRRGTPITVMTWNGSGLDRCQVLPRPATIP